MIIELFITKSAQKFLFFVKKETKNFAGAELAEELASRVEMAHDGLQQLFMYEVDKPERV